jgi:predicted nucleotidyltransferase component of viral defense system
MERFLYRLSQARHGSRFILKGALLLRVWDAPTGRPTMDIDLLGRTDNDVEAIVWQVRDALREPVEGDGLAFDVQSVEARRIVEDATYHGIRVRLTAHLAAARIRLQVDIGFGDPVHPAAAEEEFPTLLSFPAPRLLCYSRESMIAEKYEAMVRYGELNSRMKDFYDVWLLSRSFAFDGQTLAEAIRRTFASRHVDVADDVIAFSEQFVHAKELQWRAFRRRSDIEHAPWEFAAVVRSVEAFLAPLATAIATGEQVPESWMPPGPWR